MTKAGSKMTMNEEGSHDEFYEDMGSQHSDLYSEKLGGLNIRLGAETFIGKRAQDLLNL
jgi:hypothetical protein